MSAPFSRERASRRLTAEIVHPAKTVVKFAGERAVFSAVHHVVKDALDGASGALAPPPVRPAAAGPKSSASNPNSSNRDRFSSSAPYCS